jgi:phage terminase large subunit
MPTVEIPYAPRKQMMAYHGRSERFACLVAHRRFGKTVAAINDLIKSCLTIQRDAVRCAYIAPYYNQAKAIAWDYVKFFTAPIPGMSYNESELRADFPNGARLRLFGADNYDAMRGLYFDDVVLDEPADFPDGAWPNVIRPALADRKGRATFIGTPKGKNAFWETYSKAMDDPAWFTAMLKASDTGILPEDELADALKTIGIDRYNQEFECSFEAAIIGAYYGKEMQDMTKAGRIRKIPYEPTVGVVTAWDLGISDTTSIVFAQFVGAEIRIIDHIEESGLGLQAYAKMLQDKPYIYSGHILPHDVRVRELGTGQSRLETLASLGIKNVQICPNLSLDDGIQAVRNRLPLTYIDQGCNRLIEALRQYERGWDEKNKTWKSNPKHNWASHTADAVRYLFVGHKDTTVSWGKPIRRNMQGLA